MFELGISTADVSSAQVSGRVIEDYPTDTPYLSCLWLGFAGNCPLHLVYADNPAPMVNASSYGERIIITVHEPDPALWLADRNEEKPMKCPICRHGETRPGAVTVPPERTAA